MEVLELPLDLPEQVQQVTPQGHGQLGVLGRNQQTYWSYWGTLEPAGILVILGATYRSALWREGNSSHTSHAGGTLQVSSQEGTSSHTGHTGRHLQVSWGMTLCSTDQPHSRELLKQAKHPDPKQPINPKHGLVLQCTAGLKLIYRPPCSEVTSQTIR